MCAWNSDFANGNASDLEQPSQHDELTEEVDLKSWGLVESVSYEPSVAPSSSHEVGFVQTAESNLVNLEEWNSIVHTSFAGYRQQPADLTYPWETGVLAEIFNVQDDHLPRCQGLTDVLNPGVLDEPELAVLNPVQAMIPAGAKYIHAVKSTADIPYFEGKRQQLDSACCQWLNILSIRWSASAVGPQLADALLKDVTGNEATEILSACFGVKSPATLLKRASAMKRFISWFDKTEAANEIGARALPLEEGAVWEYFLYLREQRVQQGRGFTTAASFLEAVRFAKFTFELQGTEQVLASRRLQGFAAIQRREKGPTRQAPGLELEHMKRLHEVLESDAENIIDRLGAGCFLMCLYGRARWSDVRFIDHVEVEEHRHGGITFFTAEHKTASVGLRLQQYLPISVPWEGISNEPWVKIFMEIYAKVGLDLHKRPLGPLLPAPHLDGSFGCRPLTTSEAAAWLRKLLHGTAQADSFRSHSLKASLLIWAAKAGMDKETRAVLSHHSTAVHGSEVVYSRHLQTRALRKLLMMIRRVRVGLGVEDDFMKEFGVISTPAGMTPFGGPRTPVIGPATPVPPTAQPDNLAEDVVGTAIQEAADLEDAQSVKKETFENSEAFEKAAEELTLFPASLVDTGVVEIVSSSGSESSSYSSSEETESSDAEQGPAEHPVFTENVPEGIDFYKHFKSGIVHSCKAGTSVSRCKLEMSSNYKLVDRVLNVRLPMCLKCFPKDNNRLRSVEDSKT